MFGSKAAVLQAKSVATAQRSQGLPTLAHTRARVPDIRRVIPHMFGLHETLGKNLEGGTKKYLQKRGESVPAA
jgi:hypothetical protein